MGATGGTQTHSRRTGSKLRQLRYARQGLVRVPESNTKYGGKRGKTGVNAAPVMLAALRGLVQDADCDHSTEEGSGHRYVTVARIEQARAAIAKAEGK